MKAVYEYIHSWLDIKISNLFIDDQKKSFESALNSMHVGQVIKYMYRIII